MALAQDFLTRIINVHWPSIRAVLGIESFPRTGESFTETSDDGLDWETDFGTSSNAASGLGYTVVCSGRKFIAFGTPRDGEPCFITVEDVDIERGIVNDDGELMWESAGSLPEDSTPQSCSFAGGGFFISYIDGDGIHSYLAVSFDGDSFSMDIDPFVGVDGVSSGTGVEDEDPTPRGGNVAYSEKDNLYVTTGYYARAYLGTMTSEEDFEARFVDLNFMSSISTDGLGWSPTFDVSEGSGSGALVDGASDIWGGLEVASNTCFGNGVFLASAAYKVPIEFYVPPGVTHAPIVVTACAVATSTDGEAWTNLRLPAAIAERPEPHLSNGGESACIGFFKTGKVDDADTGFFVVAGLESFSGDGDPTFQSKRWHSLDGADWTLVTTTSDQYEWILSTSSQAGTVVSR